jgi:hypothetical protein
MLPIKKVTTALLLGSLALALGAHSISASAKTPNGKPFVALEGQIVEVQGSISTVQDQIDDLVGQVDNIEDRLIATEQAIIELNLENEYLELLIGGAYTSIDAIQTEIDTLSNDVEANEGLITTLQAAIASIQSGQIDLANNLQTQIDNNSSLLGTLQASIDAINEFITMDQHIAEGTCPEGQYVIGHTADSVSCAPVEGSGTASAIGYFTFARSASFGRNAQAYCHLPTDIRTGGGFNAIQTNDSVRRSTPTGVNGWTVESVGNQRDIQAYVMCLRIQ